MLLLYGTPMTPKISTVTSDTMAARIPGGVGMKARSSAVVLFLVVCSGFGQRTIGYMYGASSHPMSRVSRSAMNQVAQVTMNRSSFRFPTCSVLQKN